MKRVILCVSVFISLTTISAAQQVKHKNATSKHRGTGKATTAKRNTNSSNTATTNVLTSSSSNSAYSNNATANNLQIHDPVIRSLNEKANGRNVNIGGSGVMGMPKATYGVANGHLIFRQSDATTSGTSTGSGAVGTGSSPGPMGTSGAVMGVNGKSPYAGPGIYGAGVTGAGVDIKGGNSDTRPANIKKQR